MAGLRERKKRDTAERIAAAAATLFAQQGYEAVAVVDVARAADVSEQTVYNHFPTKEDLVFDRSGEMQDAVTEAVRSRAPGESPADAVGVIAGGLLDRVATLPPIGRGGMPRLTVSSATLARGALARTRVLATRLADVLRDQGTPSPDAAITGWALAGVLQLLIEQIGEAQLAGEDPQAIARRLRVSLQAQLERLGPLSGPEGVRAADGASPGSG